MLHVIIRPPFDELLDLSPIKRTEQGVNDKYQCAHFGVGQSTAAIPIDLVKSVWADGPELIEIIKHFESVPKRFNRFNVDPTMKWFGDHAKFIVANWT